MEANVLESSKRREGVGAIVKKVVVTWTLQTIMRNLASTLGEMREPL